MLVSTFRLAPGIGLLVRQLSLLRLLAVRSGGIVFLRGDQLTAWQHEALRATRAAGSANPPYWSTLPPSQFTSDALELLLSLLQGDSQGEHEVL